MTTFINIKKTKVYLFTLLASILFSFSASAHFGSKGPFGGTVSCMIQKDSIVYVGTLNGGVYESTNKQVTAWRARPVGLKSGKITSLAHSGKYLFAGTADSGIFVFNGYVGSDRYWNKINKGLSNLSIKSLFATDTATILAGTNGSGLFRSTDRGNNWVAINDANLSNAIITGFVKAGTRIILITENKGVFKSEDDGLTWSDFNDANTLNIAGTKAISYNSTRDEIIVLNNNGLFIASTASTSTNAVFTNIQTGLPAGTLVRGITESATNWYLATDKGVYTTDAATINWSAINTGMNTSDVTAIVTSSSRLIAGTVKEGLFKAITGTHTWATFNTSFNNPITQSMATSGDSLVIAVTDKGVYISKDLATTYTLSNNGITDLNINDLIVADFCLLAATKNGGVFFSPDTGKVWTAINTGLSNLNIKQLFYANHYKYAIDADGKVFESGLHSSTWAEIQTGLPSAVIPTSMTYYAGKLILGTYGNGVYARAQNGTSWEAINTGLSNLNITSVTASGNKLFVGTDGSGVFVSDFKNINWLATSATSIAHTTMIGLNGNKIQAMNSFGGYVFASYKGGLLATSDNGVTWIAGGNQFNLPSFTDVKKINFVSARVFVTTENNAIYSNALSELPVLADFLILSTETEQLPETASSTNVSVTTNKAWTALSNQAWISVNHASGIRNGDFHFSLSANTGAPRTGTITVTSGTQTKTIEITQDGAVGISLESNFSKSIKVYPNPSEGMFTIDLSQSNIPVNTILISDVTGKTINEIKVNEIKMTSSLNYPSGVYFIRFISDNDVATKRIIVK